MVGIRDVLPASVLPLALLGLACTGSGATDSESSDVATTSGSTDSTSGADGDGDGDGPIVAIEGERLVLDVGGRRAPTLRFLDDQGTQVPAPDGVVYQIADQALVEEVSPGLFQGSQTGDTTLTVQWGTLETSVPVRVRGFTTVPLTSRMGGRARVALRDTGAGVIVHDLAEIGPKYTTVAIHVDGTTFGTAELLASDQDILGVHPLDEAGYLVALDESNWSASVHRHESGMGLQPVATLSRVIYRVLDLSGMPAMLVVGGTPERELLAIDVDPTGSMEHLLDGPVDMEFVSWKIMGAAASASDHRILVYSKNYPQVAHVTDGWIRWVTHLPGEGWSEPTTLHGSFAVEGYWVTCAAAALDPEGNGAVIVLLEIDPDQDELRLYPVNAGVLDTTYVVAPQPSWNYRCSVAATDTGRILVGGLMPTLEYEPGHGSWIMDPSAPVGEVMAHGAGAWVFDAFENVAHRFDAQTGWQDPQDLNFGDLWPQYHFRLDDLSVASDESMLLAMSRNPGSYTELIGVVYR